MKLFKKKYDAMVIDIAITELNPVVVLAHFPLHPIEHVVPKTPYEHGLWWGSRKGQQPGYYRLQVEVHTIFGFHHYHYEVTHQHKF